MAFLDPRVSAPSTENNLLQESKDKVYFTSYVKGLEDFLKLCSDTLNVLEYYSVMKEIKLVKKQFKL
jgi:hypothetical protein